MEEKENSEEENSEIDDQQTVMLMQMKNWLGTLKKYEEMHEYNINQLDVSHVCVQKAIQSPLKLSLSQIFQGHMNDFLDDQEIKMKYYKQLERDFNMSPSYNTKG